MIRIMAKKKWWLRSKADAAVAGKAPNAGLGPLPSRRERAGPAQSPVKPPVSVTRVMIRLTEKAGPPRIVVHPSLLVRSGREARSRRRPRQTIVPSRKWDEMPRRRNGRSLLPLQLPLRNTTSTPNSAMMGSTTPCRFILRVRRKEMPQNSDRYRFPRNAKVGLPVVPRRRRGEVVRTLLPEVFPGPRLVPYPKHQPQTQSRIRSWTRIPPLKLRRRIQSMNSRIASG